MGNKWTTDRPKEDGWYWARYRYSNKNGEYFLFEMVLISIENGIPSAEHDEYETKDFSRYTHFCKTDMPKFPE